MVFQVSVVQLDSCVLNFILCLFSLCQFFSATKTGRLDYLVKLYMHSLIEVSFGL